MAIPTAWPGSYQQQPASSNQRLSILRRPTASCRFLRLSSYTIMATSTRYAVAAAGARARGRAHAPLRALAPPPLPPRAQLQEQELAERSRTDDEAEVGCSH